MSIDIPTICLTSIGPLITLSVAGLLVLVLDAFSIKGAKKGYFHQISLVAVIIGIIQTTLLWSAERLDVCQVESGQALGPGAVGGMSSRGHWCKSSGAACCRK